MKMKQLSFQALLDFDVSDEEYQKALNRRNKVEGREGIDCPLCDNHEYTWIVHGNNRETKPCICANKRNSIARIRKSGLLEQIKRCTFSSFQTPEKWQEIVKETVMKYVSDENRRWLLVSGQSGCGKSHICTAACNEFLQAGAEVRYMRWIDESILLKASINSDVRPALILPTNLLVNGDSSIFINTAPTTPASINIPSTIYGGNNIDITWGVSTDIDGNLSGYKLEKSVNGGSSWSQIYQGSAINTTDHVSYGTTTVMYRVKAYDALGLESGYKTSNNITVINNTAPTIPSSIMVPDVIIGGKTLNISWGASTDAQGDIIKYQLERSINSGGSYTKIYDGTDLSYIDTINIAWTKVLYRVRAYDTLMAYSAYKSSTDKNVLNLSIASINVPSIAMQGQQIPISWSAAPNADSYTLERNADNSTWESIYTGSDTSYTDTATSWNTVKYRVKASNNGNWGDYKTSSAIPVITPNALTISGEDSDLGTLTNNVPYTVSTDTGNTISLERYVNGQLIAKINVNSGFSYTIPVIDLPTGTGTIKLVATVQTLSGSPVSKTRIWTYNKTPVNFPDNGGVGALTQDGNNIFPPTLAECVRVSAQFGGSLDKALELISPLLNMAVMAVGSYIGSGTFGQDSPNSLTFDFSPQMVIISGGNKSLTISNTIKTDGGTVGYIEGTKVTWYNSLGADEQLNQSETTYTYIAVGKQVQT